MLADAILCVALAVYHEARGEPLVGQHAVAQVVMNRALRDPAKACEVVFKPYQFSWANPLTTAPNKQVRKQLAKSYLPRNKYAWNLAKQIAHYTVNGVVQDFTNGATHYHATRVNPYWADRSALVATIGNHVFYKGIK